MIDATHIKVKVNNSAAFSKGSGPVFAFAHERWKRAPDTSGE